MTAACSTSPKRLKVGSSTLQFKLEKHLYRQNIFNYYVVDKFGLLVVNARLFLNIVIPADYN